MCCTGKSMHLLIFMCIYIYSPPLQDFLLLQLINYTRAQGKGAWPSRDPWGVPFSENYHPARAALAGQDLASGWRAVFAGMQGDQEFLHKLFRFQRYVHAYMKSFVYFQFHTRFTILKNPYSDTCTFIYVYTFDIRGSWHSKRTLCCQYCEAWTCAV